VRWASSGGGGWAYNLSHRRERITEYLALLDQGNMMFSDKVVV